MKYIGADLIRVTEAAAIAASQWIGSGQKEEADKAATEAMRERLNDMGFAAKIVIGEGKKDESFGLFDGEWVGELSEAYFQGNAIQPYDIAVDPIEGTVPTVTSGPEAISVIALAGKDTMFSTDEYYAKKLAYGPNIKSKTTLSLTDSIEEIVQQASVATGKDLNNLVVCILNRPRHEEIIAKLREMRVRIKLIQDCDVSGAIATCLPSSGVDILYGIGGTPEAVISACAIKCLGGDFQSQINEGDILTLEDLVKGECVFAATGITNGSMLKGVRYSSRGAWTNSVLMRSESGTVRWHETDHGN